MRVLNVSLVIKESCKLFDLIAQYTHEERAQILKAVAGISDGRDVVDRECANPTKPVEEVASGIVNDFQARALTPDHSSSIFSNEVLPDVKEALGLQCTCTPVCPLHYVFHEDMLSGALSGGLMSKCHAQKLVAKWSGFLTDGGAEKE